MWHSGNESDWEPWGCGLSCGVGRRCSLDLALLWLWHRPPAVAPIRLLAWESPYTMGVALKSKKKKKKNSVISVIHPKASSLHVPDPGVDAYLVLPMLAFKSQESSLWSIRILLFGPSFNQVDCDKNFLSSSGSSFMWKDMRFWEFRTHLKPYSCAIWRVKHFRRV